MDEAQLEIHRPFSALEFAQAPAPGTDAIGVLSTLADAEDYLGGRPVQALPGGRVGIVTYHYVDNLPSGAKAIQEANALMPTGMRIVHILPVMVSKLGLEGDRLLATMPWIFKPEPKEPADEPITFDT
jgi:hypothetical protein